MKKTIFILLSMLLIVTACTKEGPAGKDGKDGVDGNANVHSTEITVYPNDWTQDGSVWSADKSVSSITQSVVDNGSVLVYIKWENNGQVNYIALPYLNLTYGYRVGNVLFANSSQPTSVLIFKVVLIDGTPPNSVDLTDYNAVMSLSNDK